MCATTLGPGVLWWICKVDGLEELQKFFVFFCFFHETFGGLKTSGLSKFHYNPLDRLCSYVYSVDFVYCVTYIV